MGSKCVYTSVSLYTVTPPPRNEDLELTLRHPCLTLLQASTVVCGQIGLNALCATCFCAYRAWVSSPSHRTAQFHNESRRKWDERSNGEVLSLQTRVSAVH